MTLSPISQSTLTDIERLSVTLHSWRAVDPENFAYLIGTRGHGKAGIQHYVLVIITDPPARLIELVTKNKFYERITFKIKAWSFSEALQDANKKLNKHLARKVTTEYEQD